MILSIAVIKHLDGRRDLSLLGKDGQHLSHRLSRRAALGLAIDLIEPPEREEALMNPHKFVLTRRGILLKSPSHALAARRRGRGKTS